MLILKFIYRNHVLRTLEKLCVDLQMYVVFKTRPIIIKKKTEPSLNYKKKYLKNQQYFCICSRDIISFN